MEIKTVRVLVALAGVSCLLILLPILWRSLGLSKSFFLVAGVVSAVAIAVLLWILFQYVSVGYRDMLTLRQSALEQLRTEYSFLRRVAGVPTKFTYESLAAATDNFRDVVGRGSTGSVFRGVLDDGTQVAVKQLDAAVEAGPEPPGGGRNDGDYFRSEISVIAKVQHMNLVRLLGYCFLPRGGPRYLVYEYAANGSLDGWIFPRKGSARGGRGGEAVVERCLPWRERYRVATNVARGLAYLHHDCRARVLHLDVKPENILLSESFRAVVSDFGLSKVMRKDESRVVTRVRGTRGYLAPEWLLEKGVTEKSDVYSYGMVLFELVGGRRNVLQPTEEDASTSYFPRVVAEKAREGRVMEVVDRRIADEADEKQVKTLVGVALWCVQEAAGLRPSMARVVDMLEGRMAVELPPETDMVIVDVFSMDDIEPIGGGDCQGGGGNAFLPVFRSEEQPGAESSRSTASTVLSGR